jgi:hypothetical protein
MAIAMVGMKISKDTDHSINTYKSCIKYLQVVTDDSM